MDNNSINASLGYWQQPYVGQSGTIQYVYQVQAQYAYLEAMNAAMANLQASINYLPPNAPAEIELIQGNPKGALYLISYAFKKAKDPVIFLKTKRDMLEVVKKLLKDKMVDQRTIIIHKISAQFKPRLVSKRVRIFQKLESVELGKQK